MPGACTAIRNIRSLAFFVLSYICVFSQFNPLETFLCVLIVMQIWFRNLEKKLRYISFFSSLFLKTQLIVIANLLILTHAGNDAMYRQSGRSVIKRPWCIVFSLLVLVLKCWILFFGNVNIETYIWSIHNVARTWIQQNVFIILPPDTNQANTKP